MLINSKVLHMNLSRVKVGVRMCKAYLYRRKNQILIPSPSDKYQYSAVVIGDNTRPIYLH